MKRVGSRRSLARLWLHGNIRLTKTCAYTGERDRRLYHVVTSAVYALPFVLLLFRTSAPVDVFRRDACQALLRVGCCCLPKHFRVVKKYYIWKKKGSLKGKNRSLFQVALQSKWSEALRRAHFTQNRSARLPLCFRSLRGEEVHTVRIICRSFSPGRTAGY